LTFPEPKEFALGLAMGSPDGAGTGADLAAVMADALEVMTRAVERGVSFVDVFAVFVPGLGVDRISDMFCNIMKSRFIQYTQQVCAARGIATEVVSVRNSSWQEATGRWSDARVALPRSPVTGGAVLLTPDRFLQDIPQRVTANGFWDWADARIGMELRADLNYAIGEELSKKEKRDLGRRLVRRSPHIAFEYVEEEAEREHRPYDVRTDPDLLVGWFEPGRAASRIDTAENGVLSQPADGEFCAWVDTLVDRFTHVVQNTDLWRVLWNEDLTKPRKELVVQAVAAAMWVESCRAAGVDFNRETNVGRGPVDFKFSAGWQHRALLEVKLARSTKLLQGAQAQLPQYLRSEQIRCGYYVCVGFTEAELSAERIARVTEICAALSEQTSGWTITPRFIDARPKQSASKL
jgi:hypothetical protein